MLHDVLWWSQAIVHRDIKPGRCRAAWSCGACMRADPQLVLTSFAFQVSRFKAHNMHTLGT